VQSVHTLAGEGDLGKLVRPIGGSVLPLIFHLSEKGQHPNAHRNKANSKPAGHLGSSLRLLRANWPMRSLDDRLIVVFWLIDPR
jgi:hypothetical protein